VGTAVVPSIPIGGSWHIRPIAGPLLLLLPWARPSVRPAPPALQARRTPSTTTMMTAIRPGLQCKPCCAGNRGLSNGVRTLNRAAASRRETATDPPAPSSQRNVFTRSEFQGQGPLHGQLSYATKAGRVEKRIIYYIVGDSINDEDHYVVPELSQPLVWICDMQYVIGQ